MDRCSEAPTAHDIEELKGHPGFRAAVETYCAANLARYQALAGPERWMVSDMGRASLSGAVVVLDALGRLTPRALLASPPVTKGEVSRGRARLYLQRAVASGLIVAADGEAPLAGDAALAVTTRFRRVMSGVLDLPLEAVARIAPEVTPALDRLGDRPFVQGVARRVGAITASRPDLFPLDSPVQLFQSRNGGSRVLEALVTCQAPGRERLLERCAYSHSGLARASRCSRPHVIQLLRDGEAGGYLRSEAGRLTIAPILSDDVERYFVHLFATVRSAAAAALREG
ncbi:hypothetical protein [Phenylobacterium kunshanense]|uniref:Uncharacterized protein n=1 Tax=Phenylobacterium kunshanense TaxID=1445034 RepID=A0A328BCC3_9CAUL|nr:hypothetical protein [Phenylobacterium kunshanense]RAK64972.1 hypothetical protein DJ019_13280 [Phenylobacterium kunshanense]